VTPKDRQEGRYLHLVGWQIAFSVVTLLSLAWGWHSYSAGRDGYTAGAMIANTLWGLNNVYAMSVIIRAALWKPDPEYDLPVMKGVQ
jgi:cellulose synthase (UDP-forming)